MTNKLIKQNLEELKKQTLLSILSAKGVIYTYYENKPIKNRKKEICNQDVF